MKKHRRFLAIGLVIMSFMLSGCGTQLYELTADEQELIVQYAAYFVAKHNIYQKDGAIIAYEEELDLEDSEVQTPDDSQNSDDTQTPSGGETDTETPSTNAVSIAEAAGLADGLEVVYKGSSVEDYIKEGSGYVAEPGVIGNVLYVLKLEMKNVSDQAIEVSNITSDMNFKLKCDGIVTGHKTTFLNSDFSTYMGTLAAGEAVELVLIFEAKPADAEKISEPTLQITVDGVTKNIEL